MPVGLLSSERMPSWKTKLNILKNRLFFLWILKKLLYGTLDFFFVKMSEEEKNQRAFDYD